MAYIRPLANGNFRADVRLKGIVKNKTFPTESLAQAWADNIENGIKTILNLDQAQLMALSEDEICALGGDDLFKQLGIDLFAIRHQAKLEAINALSKKELLQLSVQEIERMGGAELFIKAGKRSSAYLGDTKNGTSRDLYLAPVVMTELKRHQEVGTGLIFPSVELPEQPMDFRKAWRNVLKAANIADRDILNPDGSIKLEKFTFHCLRHGFCSALSDSGKEINQIAKLAGHKSIQTTMRYIHQGRDQKRQIVNELAQAFKL
ncbi:site-specific integrase [Methylomonas montana]|uniref:site-specific integrase n=1 Tax=Methylomonas montana TaxID=3058963 RepID=UPI002658C9B3|nr:site-specific integrase [Methylomonas montana]WKJ91337.1 site-specific integrase [Methylomonas montana]